MTKHVVCTVDELGPGQSMIVEVAGRSIGVFNVDGSYYALRNRCPHKGAPLCRGYLKGLITSSAPYAFEITREGEILRCPWHGWEFDVTNGRSVYNPHRVRVRSYDVTVEADEEPDPAVETYAVSVERAYVVLHLNA